MDERTAPVKEGEQYEVHIDSVGGKGDGIARVKGFVLFVPNTKEGDFVMVKVTKVLEKVGFAEVVKQLEKKERASRQKRFETISKEELERIPEKPAYNIDIEDTDDFGEDLDEPLAKGKVLVRRRDLPPGIQVAGQAFHDAAVLLDDRIDVLLRIEETLDEKESLFIEPVDPVCAQKGHSITSS